MTKKTGFWQFSAVIGFLGLTFIDPLDHATWFIEATWIVVAILVLTWIWRQGVRLTPLLSWFLVLHAFVLIYGAWYTFSRVPLGDWWSQWFGWERNHYDRLAHFAQGFCPAVLIREVLCRKRVVNGRAWREFLVFACAMASAGIFELIEFAMAVLLGDGTPVFLGSQGDVWDAQWDMLWCGVGAIFSIVLTLKRHDWEMTQLMISPQ